MTQKVLFWISRDLIHFCIAKFLQNTKDLEFDAIIETFDKPKRFFQNQKIVDFKKAWYFDEEIKNVSNKPDIDFLKQKESEYKISIWKMSYGERLFLEFNKYHKFSSDEILSFFEQELKFFEKILDESKPDYFITRVPDFHHIQLLYEICKARKIQPLILQRTRFSLNNWVVNEDPIKLNDSKLSHIQNENDLEQLMQKFDSTNQLRKISDKQFRLKSMMQKNALRSTLNLFFAKGEDNDRERFLDHGRTKFNIIRKNLLLFFRIKYRTGYIKNNFTYELNPTQKYVYFPLHAEPERTILIGSPFFTNQLEVIKNIAKSIPIDYKLYVKEHPFQKKLNWRPTSYYKEIMKLPNVKLLHPVLNSEDLVKNSDLVIAIAGTAGIQAAIHNKPSIIFSDQIYDELPSVYRLRNLEQLPEIIKSMLQKNVNQKDVIKFVNKLLGNSFEFDSSKLQIDHPFQGTLISNLEITDEIITKYIDLHKDSFGKLANEHLKKMDL